MKAIPLMAALCCLVVAAYPQGGPDDACSSFCVQVRDYSCSDHDNCGAEDCESYVFTTPCTDEQYLLRCEVVCTGGNCEHCMAWTCIRDGANLLAEFCGTNNIEQCEGPCSVTPYSVSLTRNQQYKLFTCLYRCPAYDCDNCENCHASVTLYRLGATCPSP